MRRIEIDNKLYYTIGAALEVALIVYIFDIAIGDFVENTPLRIILL